MRSLVSVRIRKKGAWKSRKEIWDRVVEQCRSCNVIGLIDPAVVAEELQKLAQVGFTPNE